MSAAPCRSEGYLQSLVTTEYYLEGGEPPGHWWGKGKEILGLPDQIEERLFHKIFHGLGPDGQKLVANAGQTDPLILKDGSKRFPHRADDFGVSASKSVSVVWAMTDDPAERLAFQTCHDRAARTVADLMEQYAGNARRGDGGNRIESADMLWGIYQHATNRNQEPDLHSHLLAFNISFRSDGTTGALYTPSLYRMKMVAGAVYQSEMSASMLDLGYSVRQEQGFAFEIVGVPKEIRDHYSTRRQEIEAALAKRQETSAKAAEIAALDTRKAKTSQLSRAELFANCQAYGRAHGFGPEEIRHIKDRTPQTLHPEHAAERLTHEAIHTLSEREGRFTRLDLLRYVATHAAAGTGCRLAHIEQAITRALTHTLEIGVARGEMQYTTPAVKEREQQQVDALKPTIEKLSRNTLHPVRPTTIEAVTVHAAKRGKSLQDIQQQALRELFDPAKHPTTQHTAVRRQVLSEAAEAWQRSGYRVVAIAPTHQEKTTLEKATSIKSFSISQALSAWQLTHYGKSLWHAPLKRLDTFVDKLLAGWQHRRFPTILTTEKQDKLALGFGLKGMTEKRARFNAWQRSIAPLKISKSHVVLVEESARLDARKLAALVHHVEKSGAKLVLVDQAERFARTALRSEKTRAQEQEKTRTQPRPAEQEQQQPNRIQESQDRLFSSLAR